jgi:DMSO reductase anchor subunit
MSTTKKTLGVTSIAIYSAFGGIICLPVGLLLLFASALPKGTGTGLFLAIGLIITLLGVFFLASVYGLWSLQDWGRKLTMWLYGASILLGIIAIFPIMPKQQFTITNMILQLVGILIDVVIVMYLSKPVTKELFE